MPPFASSRVSLSGTALLLALCSPSAFATNGINLIGFGV